MTEPTRPLWQIEAQMKALKAERKAARVQTFGPARKVGGRTYKPEGPGQRQPRERDNRHLQFIRRLPCACGCGAPPPCDAAHVRMPDPARGKRHTGKGEKPSDRWTLPLRRACHEVQHSGSEAAFWSARGIDPIDLCIRLYAVSGDEEAAVRILRTAMTANDTDGEGRTAC